MREIGLTCPKCEVEWTLSLKDIPGMDKMTFRKKCPTCQTSILFQPGNPAATRAEEK